MKKLSKKDKIEILNKYFTSYDLLKIFETTDIGWLSKQDIRLDYSKDSKWPDLYFNGDKYTSINLSI